MKKHRWILISLAAGVAILGLVLANRPQSDSALATELVGKWQAVDTSNAALHKQKEPIEKEQIEVKADGNLLYAVSTKAAPNEVKTDRWGWRVRKGHLSLQFRGEDAADDWMPSMHISLSENKLSIVRKGFPAKEFTRLNG